METVVKQLTKDIEILKKQNKELQYEIQNEKIQRIEMSVVLVDILKTLKEHNITIVKQVEKIEEVVDEELEYTQKDEGYDSLIDEPTPKQSLAPTVVDEPAPKQSLSLSFAPTVVDEPTPKQSLVPTIESVEDNTMAMLETPKKSPTFLEEEKTQKEELVSTLVDDFDMLSDNETLEKSPSLTVDTKSEIDMTKPPLPSNLIMSPMTPKNEVEEEKVVEEVKEVAQKEKEVVKEVAQKEKSTINYKKMKVGELKKMCKEKGIKGYSKLKKQALIDLLSN